MVIFKKKNRDHIKQVYVFPYLKNHSLVCVITLSKATTGIIVQWKLIT